MPEGWRVGVRRRLLALLAVYAAIFAVSAVGGTFDLEPPVPIRPVFLGNLMLLVGGAAGALWLLLAAGRRGLLAAGLVAGLAYAVEGLGQATGVPFGRYRYSGALTPALPGEVPLAILAAWLLVVVAALGTAAALLPDRVSRPLLAVVAGGLVLGLDLQIETVAAHVQGYWTWLEGGPYYGVPTRNFAAWLVVGLALCGLTAWLCGERAPSPQPSPRGRGSDDGSSFPLPVGEGQGEGRSAHCAARSTVPARSTGAVLPWAPVVLFTLISLLFTLINLTHGYPVAGLVGTVLLALVAVRTWQRRVSSDQVVR